MSDEPRIAMQVRCVNCLAEQYALAVSRISRGEQGCVWCGHVPPVYTDAEYREALRLARARKEAQS